MHISLFTPNKSMQYFIPVSQHSSYIPQINMVIPDSLCTAHSTTLHMYTRQPTYAMFGSNKSLQHNSHSNMEYRPSTASVPPHHLHIQDRSYMLCSVMFNEIAATHNIPHSTAFHMQVTNTRHSW